MLRCIIIMCGVYFVYSNASAIPVWEFLSKQEKMSFLYSIFANLVEDFCETSSIKDCNKDLLKYGLKTLKKTQETSLDNMDPYQKDSQHIIWSIMLEGNPLGTNPPKQKPSTTPTPNSYNDKTIDDFDTAATGDLDNIYRLPPPEGFKVEKFDFPPNVAALLDAADASEEEEELFVKFQDYFANVTNSTDWTPLNGPVVVKVHPDGTPVEELTAEHHDEDLRQHLLAQVPIPESV